MMRQAIATTLFIAGACIMYYSISGAEQATGVEHMLVIDCPVFRFYGGLGICFASVFIY